MSNREGMRGMQEGMSDVSFDKLNDSETAKNQQSFLNYSEEIGNEGEKSEFQVEWKKIENEFGDVEVSIYRKKGKKSNKAIFYLAGLKGYIDDFKTKHISNLINKGNYDVVIVNRNGADLTKNTKITDSKQRVEYAKQNSQDHLGKQNEYGYKEWTKEFACAATGLSKDYEEIKIVGHSFGGLIGLEGLRLLNESKNSTIREDTLPKIKIFVSLSGQIGKPYIDKDGRMWVDKKRKYAYFDDGENATTIAEKYYAFTKSLGELNMKDPKEITQETINILNRIYDKNTQLPEVPIIQVMPGIEKYFSTEQVRALLEKNGENSLFVGDRSQRKYADVDNGEEVNRAMLHGFPTLTTSTLMKLLDTKPADYTSKILTLNSQDSGLKPWN